MNMKKFLLCVFGVLAFFTAFAVEPLRFNHGQFKIVQVTDCHYKFGKSSSETAVKMIREAIQTENPDLVVFTGDNIYSDNAYKSINILADPLEKAQIPFVMLFGNHDVQFDMTLSEQYDLMRSFSYNIQPNRPEGVESPDFALPVLSSDGSRVAQILYCMDSHDAYHPRSVSRYDWIKFSQIAWYRKTSNFFTEQNGGEVVPSIAFFHIPLPEYAIAYESLSKGKKKVMDIVGTKGENVCCPELNSGFFTSMYEMGDIRAVFCGHDHDNDFALVWKNIMLAYGRYSGGDTVYNHLGKNGVRVIELYEDRPNIHTYIHLIDGEIINECEYPMDFPVTPDDD